MKELMLMLAKEMPEAMLIEKLQESLDAFKNQSNKETKSGLSFYSQMIAIRFGTEDKSTIDTLNQFSKGAQLLSAFDEKR